MCQVLFLTLYNAILLGDFKAHGPPAPFSWPALVREDRARRDDFVLRSRFKVRKQPGQPDLYIRLCNNSQCSVEIYGKLLDYTVVLESVVTEKITLRNPNIRRTSSWSWGKRTKSRRQSTATG